AGAVVEEAGRGRVEGVELLQPLRVRPVACWTPRTNPGAATRAKRTNRLPGGDAARVSTRTDRRNGQARGRAADHGPLVRRRPAPARGLPGHAERGADTRSQESRQRTDRESAAASPPGQGCEGRSATA